MTVSWNIVSNSEDGTSAANVIFPDGTTFDVNSKHPNYLSIVNILATLTNEENVDEVRGNIEELVNVATTISDRLTSLSERVTTDGLDIYFDGDVIDSSVATYLLKALRRDGIASVTDEGDSFDGMPNVSWRGIVAFMEKLYQNPSKESIEHLYSFIRLYDLTIRENGDFIAFKGLWHDFTSIHHGPGIINGVRFANTHLDNKPGNVVEIARSYVNTDREHGCSTGLHCGTLNYARSFAGGGKLVSVAVNPRDVVSVPHDASYQKVRVSRYEVLSEVPNDFTEEDRDFFWGDESNEDCFECSECGCEIYDSLDDGYDPETGDPICEECESVFYPEYDNSEFEDKYLDHTTFPEEENDQEDEMSECSNCGRQIYDPGNTHVGSICEDCQLDEKESSENNEEQDNDNPGISFL